jgi:hypothetical protein
MAARKAGDAEKIKQLGTDLVEELKGASSALNEDLRRASTSEKDKEILHLKISILKDLVDDLGLYLCHGARSCFYPSAAPRKKAHSLTRSRAGGSDK